MKIPNKDTRKKIVYRIAGSRSVVQASSITNPEELAYGMSFLAHHRLYKMSKSGGVGIKNAEIVAKAFSAAAEAFAADVTDALKGVRTGDRISDLGRGTVDNPYGFVGH